MFLEYPNLAWRYPSKYEGIFSLPHKCSLVPVVFTEIQPPSIFRVRFPAWYASKDVVNFTRLDWGHLFWIALKQFNPYFHSTNTFALYCALVRFPKVAAMDEPSSLADVFLAQSSGSNRFKYSSIKPALALSSVCASWASFAASANLPDR